MERGTSKNGITYMKMNQICIFFWGTKSRDTYEDLILFQSNLWAIDSKMRPQAETHMKISDPCDKNYAL